jgi:hypothetical protein
MAKETIGAGFRYLWYGVNDSDGYFIGSTTTAPAAGNQSGSGMARLAGARTLPINIPEPDVEPVTGDDEPLVTFEFDSETPISGAFEMAVRNNTFDALIQGTKVNTIESDIEVSILDPKDRDSQSMCMLLSRRAKSWQSGTKGVKKWENAYVPRCTIKPLFTDIQQRTFTPYHYAINLSRSDRTGWSTVSINLHGTTAGSIFLIDSDNPLYLHRFTGDAAEVAFTLTYEPVSGAKTYVFVNDVVQTVTTDYTVSGKVVTFEAGSTPASDAVIDILAEIDESNLS